MPDGIVVRGQGGLYYIWSDGTIVQSWARGKIKKQLGEILVGDHVQFSYIDGDEGVVDSVLPRRNKLIRPAIANIDQMITVFSLASPDPIPLLIDKFLVTIQSKGLKPVIVFSKADISRENRSVEVNGEYLPEIYKKTGYSVYITSAKEHIGIAELQHALKDKVTVFAGPSGVGKSALLNCLQDNIVLLTGDVSEKIRRGKHTTRHASLLALESGGWVADTPGFSVVDLTDVKKEELTRYFPEFNPYIDQCRFAGCMHRAEPDCSVKRAVEDGSVDRTRYDNYVLLLGEIENQPPPWARKSED